MTTHMIQTAQDVDLAVGDVVMCVVALLVDDLARHLRAGPAVACEADHAIRACAELARQDLPARHMRRARLRARCGGLLELRELDAGDARQLESIAVRKQDNVVFANHRARAGTLGIGLVNILTVHEAHPVSRQIGHVAERVVWVDHDLPYQHTLFHALKRSGTHHVEAQMRARHPQTIDDDRVACRSTQRGRLVRVDRCRQRLRRKDALFLPGLARSGGADAGRELDLEHRDAIVVFVRVGVADVDRVELFVIELPRGLEIGRLRHVDRRPIIATVICGTCCRLMICLVLSRSLSELVVLLEPLDRLEGYHDYVAGRSHTVVDYLSSMCVLFTTIVTLGAPRARSKIDCSAQHDSTISHFWWRTLRDL